MIKDRAQKPNSERPNTNVNTGQYVVNLRESVGWSQAELARQTGIDKSDLSKIEHNQRSLSGVWLILFHEAVQNEKNRLRLESNFSSDQERHFYENYTVKMLRDMEHLGMSESKIEGVRETMSGLIKSVFAK